MDNRIIGPGITKAGLGGDKPQFNTTGKIQFRGKRLFFSRPEQALILQKMLKGGYGDLEEGTVMAVHTTTGLLYPYIPDTFSASDVGRIMLVTDNITSATFMVWKEDAGKLAAGDVIVLWDTDGTYEEATVSTVADSGDGRRYTVTLSAATATAGGFIVSKSACCWLKGGSAGKRSDAKFILDAFTSTGDIENPNGAFSSVVVSNAILYADGLVGADATALTALGAVTDSPYVILK